MLKKKPVTGMRDMSPKEMEIRDYVLKTIREVYTGYGFTQIESITPESLYAESPRVIDIAGFDLTQDIQAVLHRDKVPVPQLRGFADIFRERIETLAR